MEKLEGRKPLMYELQKDNILYFLHIPKTAGLNTANILDNHFDCDAILRSKRWDQLLLDMPKNFSKFRLVRGHFGYDFFKILPKKPIYITFLRNPDDIIISQYKHLQRDPHFRKRHNISEEESMSDLILRPVIHNQENPQCRWLVAEFDVLSKTKGWDEEKLANFVPEDQPEFNMSNISEGELFEIAKDRLVDFAFFGLVEKYEESLFLLHYTLGWKPIRNVARLNVAPNKNKTISTEASNVLEDRTRADVKLYQFAKQLFESRYSQMVEDLKGKYYVPSYENMAANDVVYNMLEKHYNDHFRDLHTEVSAIDCDFSKRMDGYGWYEREFLSDKKTIFRWTGPETKSVINFPLKTENDLKIKFHVRKSMNPDILISLQLKVNETHIELKKSSSFIRRLGTTFEGIIPKAALSDKPNFTRLTFEVNRTVSPKSTNPDSTDDRKMGLAFDWIKISPVEK